MTHPYSRDRARTPRPASRAPRTGCILSSSLPKLSPACSFGQAVPGCTLHYEVCIPGLAYTVPYSAQESHPSLLHPSRACLSLQDGSKHCLFCKIFFGHHSMSLFLLLCSNYPVAICLILLLLVNTADVSIATTPPSLSGPTAGQASFPSPYPH